MQASADSQNASARTIEQRQRTGATPWGEDIFHHAFLLLRSKRQRARVPHVCFGTLSVLLLGQRFPLESCPLGVSQGWAVTLEKGGRKGHDSEELVQTR